MGILPSFIICTLLASMSTQMTWLPVSAKQVPVTSPYVSCSYYCNIRSIFVLVKKERPEYPEDWLIQALREGRVDAFERMFRETYAPLVRSAAALLGRQEEAEDVVQRVFVQMWERRGETEIGLSVRAYLFRSVRNGCLNVLRHRKVRGEYAREMITQSPGGTPEADGDAGALEQKLAEALSRLPDRCRQIFEASRFEGKKYAEIAGDMGISVKTVENQMGKALRIMRVELSDFLIIMLLITGDTL
jgi:RNA polymerase sigma-70 factor (family 1)